jgi:hypothetical protein
MRGQFGAIGAFASALSIVAGSLAFAPVSAVSSEVVVGSQVSSDRSGTIDMDEAARLGLHRDGPVVAPEPGIAARPSPPSAAQVAPPAAGSQPAPASPAAGEPSPDPPVLTPSFQALGDDNMVIPPDTNGAVGPSHVVTMLNSQVRVQSRTGTNLSTASLTSFWSGVGSSPFDPRTLYDPYGARWIAVAVTDRQSAGSSLLIGASATSDPTGTWCLRRVDADSGNTTWADFPTVGFNKDWIVVGANMFNNSDNVFSVSKVWAWPRSSVYAACPSAISGTMFTMSGLGFTHQPAVTYDTSLATEYLMNMWNETTGTLRIFSITGPVSSPVITPGAFVSGPAWTFQPAAGLDFAPQAGSSTKIQSNDSRLGNVVYRNGQLWTAHTIFLPSGGSPTRASVQWWEVTPAGVITQRGVIDDSSGTNFYAFPSIAVNSIDDALVGYSRFSGSQFASANYSFRYGVDPASTLQADTVLKAGEAKYAKFYTGPRNRWGDYSATVVDPVNDIDMWTLQEYAWTPGGGNDRWATWWGRVVPSGTPGAALSPSALSFGDRHVGLATPSQTVTLTNAGTGTMTVSAASITGTNPTQFTKTSDSCSGATIVPGGFCAVGVAFSPSSTGSKSAALSFASNAPGSPHIVSLSGTGVIDTTPPASSPSAFPVLVAGLSSVVGSSTDVASGVFSVTVVFQPVVGAASSVGASLACGPGSISCTFTALVPLLLLPGPYTIFARGTDFVGNAEFPGGSTFAVVV